MQLGKFTRRRHPLCEIGRCARSRATWQHCRLALCDRCSARSLAPRLISLPPLPLPLPFTVASISRRSQCPNFVCWFPTAPPRSRPRPASLQIMCFTRRNNVRRSEDDPIFPGPYALHRYSSDCGKCFVCFVLGPCTWLGQKQNTPNNYHKRMNDDVGLMHPKK